MADLQLHAPGSIAVGDVDRQKIQKLQARMLKGHVGLGIGLQHDQVGLEEEVTREHMADSIKLSTMPARTPARCEPTKSQFRRGASATLDHFFSRSSRILQRFDCIGPNGQ